MNVGYREECLEHDTGPRHPESPDRLRAVRRRLSSSHGVRFVDAPPASESDVVAVHDDDYIAEFREFCEAGGGNWDADTVGVEATWDAALSSAGLAMWTARQALDGANGRNTPFAAGRPPGHHARPDDAMGFCFVNNVAVAAQHALDDCGADRVAIFDWDVHHGNGTQDRFYDRGDVFFASIHEEGLFPGTGDIEETGVGKGAGTTLNVPFPPGTATEGYLAAVDECVLPAFEAFDPDLVLVSAGFDAHEHDPISRMRVATEGYGLMADRFREFDVPLGFVLEGGYGLDTLADGVNVVNEIFDGYTPVEPGDDVQDGARAVIDKVRDGDVEFA